jgi:two-component system LytT family response regulator
MRIVIVDDEPLARLRLRQVLADELGVDVVAECACVREARRAIEMYSPEAVFVDIEMPGESGLVLAREMESEGRPVVFVTAHENYAVEAFDSGPVDYVLKPPEAARCRRAIRRIANVLEARSGARPKGSYLERLFVRNGERLVHLRTADLDWIEALGNYVKLRVARQSHLLRASLNALESRLDPAQFLRTHRSAIVNLAHVRELIAVSHGDYQIIFEDGAVAPLSRRYKDKLGLT